MDDVRVLDAAHTRAALDPSTLLTAIEVALRAVADDSASCPARIAAHTPHGLLGAMPGYVPGLGLAAKLTTVYPSLDDGRSRHRGIVVSFDENTGRVRTIMDAESITAGRTAATATTALRVLARKDRQVVAVIGAGVQARAQLAFLRREPEPLCLVVGVRDPDRWESTEFGERVTITHIEDAVRAADVVMCCTGARTPVIDRAWLRSGVHVSSIGGSEGPEIDEATLRSGTIFTEWLGAALEPPPAGAYELQGRDASSITLLGEVLRGARPGRTSDDQLTVFKSTGHATLDVAAAYTVDTSTRGAMPPHLLRGP